MIYTVIRSLRVFKVTILTMVISGVAACAQTSAPPSPLPDAPSVLLSQQEEVVVAAEESLKTRGSGVASCTLQRAMLPIPSHSRTIVPVRVPCNELVNPYQRFLDTNLVIPLTAKQKGYLAIHNLTDPANLLTIVAVSGFSTAIDSHSPYGPGLKGFGKNTGVSLLQDATGEFFGAFLIPSVTHQDPRYFRMPHASIPRRIVHAVGHTFVANHDDGRLMPNYANLLGYPISAELSNLYVPGIHADPSSTITRIVTGLATDPANNLVTEFLPDVARHISIRIIFVQRILNQVASQQQQGAGSTF
jgi:hypothetical protein